MASQLRRQRTSSLCAAGILGLFAHASPALALAPAAQASSGQAPATVREAQRSPEPKSTPAQQQAQQRYRRALELYDEGAADEALLELKRAHALAPTFRLLYNLGIVSLQVRDYAGAMDYFERYLREGGAHVPPALSAEVTGHLRDLAARVAHVTIRTNVPGAELAVDDRLVGVAPLQRSLRVNAGTRRLSARANGWLPHTAVIELAGADRVDVEIALITLISPEPQARYKTDDDRPARNVPWLGWAGAAALAGGAAFAGAHAMSAHQSYERKREQLGITRAELDAMGDRTLRWSIAADALGVSAVGVASYCAWLMLRSGESNTAPEHSSASLRVEILPDAVAMSGTF